MNRLLEWLMEKLKGSDDPADIICPVCGYYCLGNGGWGCIDKPALQEAALGDEDEM